MKLLAYIKLTLVQSFRESGQLLLVFAIFPIAISVMMAYFQNDLFTATTEISKLEISISDEDKSQLSNNLVEFFNTDAIKKLVEVKATTEKVDYEISIPKGYQEKLINESKNTAEVKVKEDSSITSGEILASIIDRYSQDINMQLMINKNITDTAVLNTVINKINKTYTADSFNTEIVQLKKNLSSYEYFSVSLLGFMFLMLTMSLAASFYLEKENGMYSRIMSTAITKTQYFNYNLITCFISALILNTVYVFTYRILGLSFIVSIPLLMLLVLVQSLLATCATALLIAFLSKKSTTIVMNVLLLLQVIIGGSFIPVEQIGASKLFIELTKFSPDALISKAYRNLLLYDNLSSIAFYIIAILAVSVIFYGVSIAKINLKWGESK